MSFPDFFRTTTILDNHDNMSVGSITPSSVIRHNSVATLSKKEGLSSIILVAKYCVLNTTGHTDLHTTTSTQRLTDSHICPSTMLTPLKRNRITLYHSKSCLFCTTGNYLINAGLHDMPILLGGALAVPPTNHP